MDFVYHKNPVLSKSRKALLLCGFIVLAFTCMSIVSRSSAEDAPSSGVISPSASAESPQNNQELINQKLEEIKKIQGDINQFKASILEKQKEGRTLENQISIYDSNIYKNQLEVQETRINIEKSELEMEDIEAKIEEDRLKIEENRAYLKEMLRVLYGYQQESLFETFIERDSLSDFFNEMNALEVVQQKIFETVMSLKQERKDLSLRNEELQDNQISYQNLLEVRYEQNISLENLKLQKGELLEITNGEEEKFQELMSDSQGLLPSLRAELRDLQSLGSSIKFDDAISAAQYVGSVTGVRPEFLLGVLRLESGLGTNVGGGNYLVDMRESQRATFEEITTGLGYDPNSMPVSKKPTTYSGWGGAMGPAQMMPTTWMIYKDRTSQITGNYPSNPWDLTDSIAAMAIKLSEVEGVTSGDYNAEYKAAGIYFAGSNWQRFTFYSDKVMYYANLYEKELGG
ncbi:MAG: hypothetical protein PHI66_03065 [Candidatus Pacebacteria bacterium]|nr:hypothetical protein [Candidatus Paceibacterota bacterium]